MERRHVVLVCAIVGGAIVITLGVLGFHFYRNRMLQEDAAVVCKANTRSLSQAFMAFAADHDNHLPGTTSISLNDANPDHADWLMGMAGLQNDAKARLQLAPQSGTIWKYLPDYQAYRCPSLEPGTVGSGIGSNGRFDYAAFPEFGGARLSTIRPTSELHDGSVVSNYPTPIICQEDPAFSINSTGLDGQHMGPDRMTHLHNGGSYYAAVDGSVQWVNEPASSSSSPGGGLWYAQGPSSGKTVPIGSSSPELWGLWGHR